MRASGRKPLSGPEVLKKARERFFFALLLLLRFVKRRGRRSITAFRRGERASFAGQIHRKPRDGGVVPETDLLSERVVDQEPE
jgi:hypothetical protein